MSFPRRICLVLLALAVLFGSSLVGNRAVDAARKPRPPATTTTTTTTSTSSTTTTSTLPPGTVAATATDLLGRLTLAVEVGTGYSRTLFTHWIDSDGDGCNTRYEVLIAESLTTPTVVPPCTLGNTTWFSAYDGITEYLPADVDIDHVVALKEAWDSGAWNWSAERRRAFANDLGDPRSLIAVTDNVNSAKGDKDPSEWMPPRAAYHCQYLFDWIAVKVRWSLTIDQLERNAVASMLTSCPATVLTISVAQVT
ncbi:MAG: HNH endonuclease family protein [Ilumatobacteraceae bacterium]